MACRKHSPGDPCCDTPGCTFNSADLPATFEFEGTTILRAEWTSYMAENTPGVVDGCCWGYSLLFPQTYSRRTFHCSAEHLLSATEATKIVTYRYHYGTYFSISKMSSVCDALPAANQYIVTILKHYFGKYNTFVYNPPSPSCEALASRLDSLFPGGYGFNYYIARTKYYATLPANLYTLTPTDVSVCKPRCQGILDYSNELVLTEASLGLTLTFNDASNWTFVTT